MKPKHLLLIISGVMIFTVSCKKNLSVSPADKPADVYLAGFVRVHHNTAAFWKNGALTLLGDTSKISFAQAIAVEGSDVYVGGVVTAADISTSNAVYWKNGTLINLSGGTNGDVRGITVNSAGDVYVAGMTNDPTNGFHAAYWKNNVVTNLTDGLSAKAITLSGSDVYIAGTAGTTNNTVAAYWKNGTKVLLQGGFMANSIAVVGNDVYVGGETINGAAIYWKNGASTSLGTGATGVQNGNGIVPGFSEITAIAANNTDIYAAGVSPDDASGSAAAYWKDNSPIMLTTPTTIANTPLNNEATAISLYHTDMYITSQVTNNAAEECESYLWKNGVATKINGNGSAMVAVNSMAVVPQP